jgi:hypothetical protein
MRQHSNLNDTYAIYDEEGLSSSTGSLKNVDQGIVGQAQWVYLWTKAKLGYWAKLEMTFLKFQKK